MKKRRALKKRQFVVPVGNGWAVKGDNDDKIVIITDTKRDAVTLATDMARREGLELVIFDKNGNIVESNKYEKAIH